MHILTNYLYFTADNDVIIISDEEEEEEEAEEMEETETEKTEWRNPSPGKK